MTRESIVETAEKNAESIGLLLDTWETIPEVVREVFWYEFDLALSRYFEALQVLKQEGLTELAERMDAALVEIYRTLDYYDFVIVGGPNWSIGVYPDRFCK